MFEDTDKYNAIMSALAEVVYREMRRKGATVSGAYIYEMPQNLSMMAENSVLFEDKEEQKY